MLCVSTQLYKLCKRPRRCKNWLRCWKYVQSVIAGSRRSVAKRRCHTGMHHDQALSISPACRAAACGPGRCRGEKRLLHVFLYAIHSSKSARIKTGFPGAVGGLALHCWPSNSAVSRRFSAAERLPDVQGGRLRHKERPVRSALLRRLVRGLRGVARLPHILDHHAGEVKRAPTIGSTKYRRNTY